MPSHLSIINFITLTVRSMMIRPRTANTTPRTGRNRFISSGSPVSEDMTCVLYRTIYSCFLKYGNCDDNCNCDNNNCDNCDNCCSYQWQLWQWQLWQWQLWQWQLSVIMATVTITTAMATVTMATVTMATVTMTTVTMTTVSDNGNCDNNNCDNCDNCCSYHCHSFHCDNCCSYDNYMHVYPCFFVINVKFMIIYRLYTIRFTTAITHQTFLAPNRQNNYPTSPEWTTPSNESRFLITILGSLGTLRNCQPLNKKIAIAIVTLIIISGNSKQ